MLSRVLLFATSRKAAHQAPLSAISCTLLKFMSIDSGMLCNHLILCCPLLLSPSIFNSFFKYLYLFICCAGSSCSEGLFSTSGEQGYSSLQCMGFSLRWLLLLRSTGSRLMGFSSHSTRAVVVMHGFNSCGSWALEHGLNI